MSNIKLVPDLFIGVAELTRLMEFVDENGFRKNILDNSVSFGLIKSNANIGFTNGRVERDVDNSLGQKTIKIAPLAAIDSNGNFLVSDEITNFPIQGDGNWYWIKVNHQYTNQERGTVSIDVSGNLVGTNTEFLKLFRTKPNFPTRIRFINSVNNTLEYDVVDVIDDTHAILAHPAITIGGDAAFVVEDNLSYKIVGTFTPGVAIPNDNKYPFNYDSCYIELVAEVDENTRPAYTIGQEFYLARVRVSNGVLIIQDKRTDYWETKGSQLSIDIDRLPNPLIGVEAAKWQNFFNTGDRNIVEIAWGMRSTNWSVDSSLNIVTLFGSSTGGSFKTVNDFNDGDFDGWRLYTANGKYSRIVSSSKQGNAINCVLDILDIDNYSSDGGDSFIAQEIFVGPNCENVELAFISDPIDNVKNVDEVFVFPVYTSIAKCLATVYKDPTVNYIIKYRYKSFKEATEWRPINSGEYYTETSFTVNGVLRPEAVLMPYISDPDVGFLTLTISPNAFRKFANTVYKGDIIGVNTITSFTAGQVINLKVGESKRYQYITGNINITEDVFINLSRVSAVEGNEFRIHFDALSLNLGDNSIFIVDNLESGTTIIVKQITQADVSAMLSQDGGIVIDCVFDNSGKWIFYQNYTNIEEVPEVEIEAKAVDRNIIQVEKHATLPQYQLTVLNRVLRSGFIYIGDIGSTSQLDSNTQVLDGSSNAMAVYKYTFPTPLPNNKYIPLFTIGNTSHNTTAAFSNNYMCIVQGGQCTGVEMYFCIMAGNTSTTNVQDLEISYVLLSIE